MNLEQTAACRVPQATIQFERLDKSLSILTEVIEHLAIRLETAKREAGVPLPPIDRGQTNVKRPTPIEGPMAPIAARIARAVDSIDRGREILADTLDRLEI